MTQFAGDQKGSGDEALRVRLAGGFFRLINPGGAGPRSGTFQSLYADRPGVWRPRDEIKVGVIYLGVALAAATFSEIYRRLIVPKSINSRLQYGLLFGIGVGASMACGGFAVHPIQPELAVGWFVLTVIEAVAGGWLVGTIIKNEPQSPSEPVPGL